MFKTWRILRGGSVSGARFGFALAFLPATGSADGATAGLCASAPGTGVVQVYFLGPDGVGNVRLPALVLRISPTSGAMLFGFSITVAQGEGGELKVEERSRTIFTGKVKVQGATIFGAAVIRI